MPAEIAREFAADTRSPAAARSFVKDAVGSLFAVPVIPHDI